MSFEDIIKNDAEQLSKAMETDAAKFFTHEVNARKMSSLNNKKYKRAMAMSKHCCAMTHTEYVEYRDEIPFYMRWYEKQYKIANILKSKIGG